MTASELTSLRIVRDALAAKLTELNAQCAALDRVGDYDSPAMFVAAAMGTGVQNELFTVGLAVFEAERTARLTSEGEPD